MTKKYISLSLFTSLLCSSLGFSQSYFEPALWLYNPTVKKATEEFPELNFKSRLTPAKTSLGTSARELQSSGHLFVVYQAHKNENLINLIGERRAVFLDSKILKINDSVDLNGYNESYGELLDIQYGGMDSGRFWMSTQTENSGVYEVVLIDKKKPARSVNEVRTYLGLKYGIDLIDYKQYTYNDKELWNGSDKTYNNRIFGVAQLSYFGLEPDKSVHSKDKDLIVSVSKRQKRIFNDGAYVLFGNNNKPFVFDAKTKQNRKQWQVQTNKDDIKVDIAFPLSKLGSSEDSFNEYELLVSSGGETLKSYAGSARDTLLVFRNVPFSNRGNSIIRLKEYRSDFKLDIDKDCDHIRLKIEGPSGIDGYRITVADDKGKNVLSETSSKKTYTIPNNASSYFDVTLNYNHKKISKRVETLSGVLRADDLQAFYTLADGAIELQLENPSHFTYNWYKDNEPIGNGNNITINQEGSYGLTVTNSSGCSITQNFNVGTESANEQWRVFPNPARSTDPVQVAFQLEEKSSVSLALYQNDGQLIRRFPVGTIDHETVNLGALNLSSGVYVLVAYINEIPQIRKIIIK